MARRKKGYSFPFFFPGQVTAASRVLATTIMISITRDERNDRNDTYSQFVRSVLKYRCAGCVQASASENLIFNFFLSFSPNSTRSYNGVKLGCYDEKNFFNTMRNLVVRNIFQCKNTRLSLYSFREKSALSFPLAT